MKVLLFTDKSLHRYLVGGWNLKGLAEGKIATLTGRTVEVGVPNERSAIKVLKRCLEDQEGWKAEDLVVYTTAGRKIGDDEILRDLGVTPASTKAALILLVPFEEAEKPDPNRPVDAGKGEAFRPRSEGSKTITISREQDQGSSRPPGSSPSRCPANSPSQAAGGGATGGTGGVMGTGHVLGGGARVAGGSDAVSQDERRRRALAAAERRMQGSGGT